MGGNILITSASKKVPLVKGMMKAAQKLNSVIKVIVGDIDDSALSRYVANDFWHMPRTIDTEFDTILSGCKKKGVSFIYPTRDGELHFWSKHKSLFEENRIKVLVPNYESVNVCLDKLTFSCFGQEKGLPVVLAAEHPDNLNADSFTVKERYGAGALKMGLNLNKKEAIQHGLTLDEPIYQPQIKGIEASIDAWIYQDNKVKGLIMRTRDCIVNGESKVTTTFRDTDIEKEVTNFLEILKLSGHVVLQVIIDNTNKLNIIECNPRFGGASTTAIAAGLDSFYWSLLEATGANVYDYPFVRIEGQVRQIRVPHDFYEYDTHF